MDSRERRNKIKKELLGNNSMPVKGQQLADRLGVTRQVIVKDIAILRAQGFNIISTAEGYINPSDISYGITKVIAVIHSKNDIENELYSVVKFGGTIKDVIIEHPLYGEIRAMIMIKSLVDLQNFMNRLSIGESEPLLKLTNGIHLHTIEAEDEETMKKIINELNTLGYLITDN